MKNAIRFALALALILAFTAVFSRRVSSQGLSTSSAADASPETLLQLDDALSINLKQLATASDRTWYYLASATGLGTNTTVWTWPVNLSCVGIASDYYQSVLIAPDKLLTCAHYCGEKGKTVQFHDTNGVLWTASVTNYVNVIGDMCISFLSNSAPASIVIPSILPPDATDYLPSHSLVGLPAFWVHRNGTGRANWGAIQYDPVQLVGDANAFGGLGTWLRVCHNGFGPFGNGSSASGGDSGSPAFMAFSNTPVLLFATTIPGDAGGLFVSSRRNFTALAAGGYTNGMKILDLRNFKKFP